MTFFFKCVDKHSEQHIGEDEQQSHHTHPDEKNMPSSEQAEHNSNGDEDQRERDKPKHDNKDDLNAGTETGWGWFGRYVAALLHFNKMLSLRLGRRIRFFTIGDSRFIGSWVGNAGITGVGEIAPAVTPSFGCPL
jgi:hypothetical protein